MIASSSALLSVHFPHYLPPFSPRNLRETDRQRSNEIKKQTIDIRE